MTAQSAFSVNLAPAFEAEHEARTSFTLARMGLYKQGLVSLRSVLELGLLSVYWDAHDEAHLDIQRWRAGAERTPVSATLHLSPATVKTHINRIFAKLDLRDRVQAVILAHQLGLPIGTPNDSQR